MVGYKMFRVLKRQPGRLFPLYVLAKEETGVGVWLKAKEGERLPDGKVRSRLGPLCFRPGWHLSDLPIAAHIGVKEGGQVRYQRPDTVWCECGYSDRVSYQEEADRRGTNAAGILVPGNAYLTHVPEDGFYRYKTNPRMTGDWVIAGSIRVERILSDREVDGILLAHGITPMPRYGGPADLSAMGFRA